MLNKLHRRFRCRRGILRGRMLAVSVIETMESRVLLSASPQLLAGDAMDVLGAVYAPRVQGAVAKPVISIVASKNKAYEGGKGGFFTVSRTGSTTRALTVSLAISGVAKNGVDYTTIPATATIPVGAASVRINVRSINDSIIERLEDVTLTLAANKAYTIASPAAGTVWIYDNDGPTVNVAATTGATSEGTTTAAVFTFTRTGGPANKPVNVFYRLASTATKGVDYVYTTRSVTIPAGQTQATVSITPIDDLRAESDEYATLTLTNGYYMPGASSRAYVTIHDNDTADVGSEFIVFRAPPGGGEPAHVFHVKAQAGAIPTNVSKALNQVGPLGVDTAINMSPSGQWLSLHTDRFGGTSGTSSLAIMRADDLTSGEQIRVGGELIVPTDGNSAVSSDGTTVVYVSEEGPHIMDLWAARLVEGVWSTELLTGEEGWDYNYSIQPAISSDGTKVVFTAGVSGSELIGEVNVDGTNLHAAVTRGNAPPDSKADAFLDHPSYGAAGTIVFGANFDAGKEQIWQLASGAPTAVLFLREAEEMTVMAPAVFSDSRIVSLWRDRAGNVNRVLELTLWYADGTYQGTLLPGVDIPSMGLGVGG